MQEGLDMIIGNEDIEVLTAEIPEGHKHLRVTMQFSDGRTLTFQEATIANLVRAYVTVKTHPLKTNICLKGKRLTDRKKSFAEWQLVEERI
jgi:hypothetical protein